MKYGNKKGYMLAEIIIALGILTVMIPFIGNYIAHISEKTYITSLKAETLSNTDIVNTIIGGLIKNSYGISYGDTIIDNNLDKLVLFYDKLERNKISIYVEQDLDYDLSRVFIQIDNREPIPLHSSHLFIKSLNFDFMQRPRNTQEADIQPWVSYSITSRSRSPLEEPTDEDYFDLYNQTQSMLYGRVLIRNYTPSSLR